MNDGKRNITSLRSQQEGICATYTYGTFGQKLEETREIAKTNPFRYSSEYHDDDLGLIYYNYRHYNPKDGRWLSPDPKQEEGGVNLYAFCTNNPTSRIDNLGLDSAGAYITGISAHWGNIVRENQPWAKVCYKYYKKANYMGDISEFFIWSELANATKLNYEERDRWVKIYIPTPTPGMLFKVPNTFVIYIANFENHWEESESGIMMYGRKKMEKIKNYFESKNVKIVIHENVLDSSLFKELWKTEGILGIGFIGHGICDKATGEYFAYAAGGANNSNGYVFIPEIDLLYRNSNLYHLSFVAALICGAKEMNWSKFVSQDGSFLGYSGAHRAIYEDWYDMKSAHDFMLQFKVSLFFAPLL